MADACLAAVGLPATADAGGLLDAWLIAEENESLAKDLEAAGLRAPVRPLWMRDLDSSTALASSALDAASTDPHQRS